MKLHSNHQPFNPHHEHNPGIWEKEEERALRKLKPGKKKSQRRKKSSYVEENDEFMTACDYAVSLGEMQGRWLDEGTRPARGNIK